MKYLWNLLAKEFNESKKKKKKLLSETLLL